MPGALQCGIALGDALGDLAACQSISQRTRLGVNHPRPAGPRRAEDDPQTLQTQLLSASSNLVVASYGTPLWMEAAAADPGHTAAFGNALVAALDPASESAARICAAERAALLALIPLINCPIPELDGGVVERP